MSSKAGEPHPGDSPYEPIAETSPPLAPNPSVESPGRRIDIANRRRALGLGPTATDLAASVSPVVIDESGGDASSPYAEPSEADTTEEGDDKSGITRRRLIVTGAATLAVGLAGSAGLWAILREPQDRNPLESLHIPKNRRGSLSLEQLADMENHLKEVLSYAEVEQIANIFMQSNNVSFTVGHVPQRVNGMPIFYSPEDTHNPVAISAETILHIAEAFAEVPAGLIPPEGLDLYEGTNILVGKDQEPKNHIYIPPMQTGQRPAIVLDGGKLIQTKFYARKAIAEALAHRASISASEDTQFSDLNPDYVEYGKPLPPEKLGEEQIFAKRAQKDPDTPLLDMTDLIEEMLAISKPEKRDIDYFFAKDNLIIGKKVLWIVDQLAHKSGNRQAALQLLSRQF